jgi:hypothetical protein
MFSHVYAGGRGQDARGGQGDGGKRKGKRCFLSLSVYIASFSTSSRSPHILWTGHLFYMFFKELMMRRRNPMFNPSRNSLSCPKVFSCVCRRVQ